MTRPGPQHTLETIAISAVMSKELGLLMRHVNRIDAVVEREAIEAVQTHRRIVVPLDILAYMAASGEPMRNLIVLDEQLESFFGAKQEPLWKSRAHFAHVSFTAWGDWPRFHAVFDARGAVSVFWLKTASLEQGSLSTVLRARWPEIDFDAPSDVVCTPMVRTAIPPPARHVVHPKFGEGTVLAEEDGKLRIDFGASGIKTLLAKFVTDAP